MAGTTMSRLSQSVRDNTKLTLKIKITVYCAFAISTLTFGMESWMTYARTEVKHFPHEEFTMPFYITWKDKVTNTDICARTGLPTTYTMLKQR